MHGFHMHQNIRAELSHTRCVRCAKFLSMQYFIDINICQNCRLIDISYIYRTPLSHTHTQPSHFASNTSHPLIIIQLDKQPYAKATICEKTKFAPRLATFTFVIHIPWFS